MKRSGTPMFLLVICLTACSKSTSPSVTILRGEWKLVGLSNCGFAGCDFTLVTGNAAQLSFEKNRTFRYQSGSSAEQLTGVYDTSRYYESPSLVFSGDAHYTGQYYYTMKEDTLIIRTLYANPHSDYYKKIK